MTTNAPSLRRFNVRRLAIAGGFGLLLVYVLLVSTGYVWLHYVRKNDRIGITQVAFFRWHQIRQAMAADQFAAGKSAWEAGNYQAAYLAFVSGVRNDPNDVDGRLLAARFLGAAGAVNLEINMLEDGLGRAPDDRRMLEQTFALLTTSGRDRHALDLLHKQFASKLSGANGPLLRTFEVLATLNSDGAAPAGLLLEKYPDLKANAESTPTVARVLWETKERLGAIDLFSAYVQSHPKDFFSYAQLARWQAACGLAEDGLGTAERACAQFPRDFAPRILLIDMTAAARTYGSSEWQKSVELFLKDFGDRPEAVSMLANLAGQNGWAGLARALYAVSANRQQNLGVLALAYSDALAANAQFGEAGQVLSQIEAQTEDGNPAFLRMLRQRQVEVAAARGDHDGTREYARRLAAVLHNDLDGMELVRRRFAQKGITEAVAELTTVPSASKAPGAR
jgi:tetratricopeptide (TPR) repeat protein